MDVVIIVQVIKNNFLYFSDDLTIWLRSYENRLRKLQIQKQVELLNRLTSLKGYFYKTSGFVPRGLYGPMRGGGSFQGRFLLEGGGTILQNSYKPSQDLEKLHCKGEAYRFSGQRVLTVQIYRQTQILLICIGYMKVLYDLTCIGLGSNRLI